MADLSSFFHMGGYAGYVWTSYGITFVVLLANVLWSARQLKSTSIQSRRRATTHRKQRAHDTSHREAGRS